MKFSIITAVYNGEATLSDALKSVASQRNCDVEHIIMDAGSTDSTLDIVKDYKNISKCSSESDTGIYDGFNKGVLLANGDIIGFLNCDDFYPGPDVLAAVALEFYTQPVDAVFGDILFVDRRDVTRIKRAYRSDRFKRELVADGWMPAHPALFIRREVFKKYGLFDTSYRIAADFEFVARIFYKHHLRYSYLPQNLVHMRTGGVSTSGIRSVWVIHNEVLRACRENGVRTSRLKLIKKYPAKIMELVNRSA